MVPFAIIAFLLGAVFSLRYTYFVLLPALPVAWFAVLLTGLIGGTGSRWIVLTMIAVTITLQLSYLVGVLIRAAYAAAWGAGRSNPENRPQIV